MDAVVQLLVFVLDGRQFALRLPQVRRVVRAVDAAPLPGAPATVIGAIDVRGQIVPLFNLRKRLGLAEHPLEPNDQFIIASTLKRTVALVVDSVQDIIERPAQQVISPAEILDGLGMIAGAVQLQDGLVLIHDLDRFLSVTEERALDDSLSRHASHGA